MQTTPHSLHLGENELTNLSFLSSPDLAMATSIGIPVIEEGGQAQLSEWQNLTSLILQNNHINDLSVFPSTFS